MSNSDEAYRILKDRGVTEPVDMAIVLGTGLGAIADAPENPVTVPFADLPGFPVLGVSGHAGRLVIGSWEGTRVAILQGRTHYYERGDPSGMRTPIETLALLGARSVVLTNSAGSTHPDWYPGQIAMLADHINVTGVNPLVGSTDDGRFVSLLDAYDRTLRNRMRRAAASAGVRDLREGVYMWFPGPSFETMAEVKMAKTLGADLVGMSTVPETILARHLGLKVVALSVITNFATGISGGNPSHAETKSTALAGSIVLKRLLRAYVRSDV